MKDDSDPELDEIFTVKLLSAVAMDNKEETTPTSGASVNQDYDEYNITITENDHPYGLLEIMQTLPSANGTIPPSPGQLHVNIEESIGTLSLQVVRAQGTVGKYYSSSSL